MAKKTSSKKPKTQSRAKVVANSKTTSGTWAGKRWAQTLVVFAVMTLGAATLLLVRAASASGPITGVGGKCLDNNAARVADGNKIQLYTCNGTDAQKWAIPGDGTIRVQGYCLDVQAASKKVGTIVQLYHCNGTVAQQWAINTTTKTIVNPNSGLCLDDQYSNTVNGNTIWMYTCNGTGAQQWTTPAQSSTSTGGGSGTGTGTGTGSTTTATTPIGQALYVSPSYANAGRSAALSSQPIAEWYGDWTPTPKDSVNTLVGAAANQKKLAQIVAYDIPHRDCGNYSAGGAKDAATYKTWIRDIAAGIGNREAIVILEPDALAQMDCLGSSDQNERVSLISDAVNVFKTQTKAYVYVDAGTSAWIGADDMASRLSRANVANARGFALNVSNFQTNASSTAYGNTVSSKVGNKPYVIDTSRNGRGPTGDNQWCNPPGRGLGKKPTTTTGATNVDAYLWIKRAGESDGNCNGGPAAGQWFESYAQMLIQNAVY
jgi:endoglucanase